jgi:hypothetical protein
MSYRCAILNALDTDGWEQTMAQNDTGEDGRRWTIPLNPRPASTAKTTVSQHLGALFAAVSAPPVLPVDSDPQESLQTALTRKHDRFDMIIVDPPAAAYETGGGHRPGS